MIALGGAGARGVDGLLRRRRTRVVQAVVAGVRGRAPAGARASGAPAAQGQDDRREGGDEGTPIVLADPDCASAQALRAVADKLSTRARGLAGMSLNISPVRR